MPTIQAALEQITGPGGPLEIVVEDVLGHPVQVYKQRRMNLRSLMEENAARADITFLVQGDRRYTFGEHDRAVRRVARGLAELGVAKGDRVAVVSANNPEWVITFWACGILGAIAVPLNAWQKSEELQFALEDSSCKVAIADRKRIDLIRPILNYVPSLQYVFLVGELDADDVGRGDLAVVRSFDELLGADDDPAMPTGDLDEDDVLAILYTSGTTGRPKGATITHRQTIANLQNLICLGLVQLLSGVASRGSEEGVQDAALLVVPLFHVTGCLATMVVNYATGAKLVLMPAGRFDADEAMATIERERVSSIGGVPTIMWRIIESPNFLKYDLSSVKRASYGGAPAAPELVERIEQAFPNLRKTLSTAYGLTETASVATALGGDDYFAHPTSCGRAVPTVELEIRDENAEPMPVGGQGEIWIKGPTVMLRGYWNRPEANAEVLVDGWFRTGDIAKQDAEGFVYIVDRAKDMIIRAGENIYCVEIENVLYEYPGVVDVAVVGVPHMQLGEEVKAVVHLKRDVAVGADEIREHCRLHLADFKVPAYIEFRAEPLPRNPAGKILKGVLRGGDTVFARSDDQTL